MTGWSAMSASIDASSVGKPSGMSTDPEQAIEHDISELEERVDGLEDFIKEAKAHANVDAIAGDWQGTDDQAGGEDPVGAHEERDEPAEDEATP
jgi:hypothetical protein